MEQYKEKLVQGTPSNKISNKFTIAINQYDNFLAASHQFLLDMKCARNADLEAHQVELKELKRQKDYLAWLNGVHLEKIESLSKKSEDCILKLTAEKNQLAAKNTRLTTKNDVLAAQNAQLTAEISEMEENNDQLTKALIRAEIEKKETESALNEKLIQMEAEKNEAKHRKEELLKKVKQLFDA